MVELFDNISVIVCLCIKLMGEICMFLVEGKLLVWIFFLLLFGVVLMINFVNFGFMIVLWIDLVGLKLIYGVLLMMVFGIWWMMCIVKIWV